MTRIFQTQFNIDLIINLCCQKAGVKREEFMQRNRRGDIILARQVAIKILMDNMLMTYTSVASTIGHRRYDHTSIMHHHRTVNELLSVADDRITTLYTEVLNELEDAVKTPNNLMVHISDDEATVHRVTDFLKKEKNVFYEVLTTGKTLPTL
jgi:hypothetical protein